VKGKKTSKETNLSKQMELVFDQHDGMDDDGIVRGGGGKLICLRGGYLSFMTVRHLVKTPCKDIVEELRSLFHDFYRDVQLMINTDEIQEEIKLLRDQDETTQSAMRKLQSSEEMLAIIDKHLASNWGVDDDRSRYYKVDLF